MRDVSVGQAIRAGLSLVGREPLAVCVWALTYLLVALLPSVWVMLRLAPEFTALATANPQDVSQMMGLQMKMLQAQGVGYLGSIVLMALLASATYRAVLDPQDRRYFYLRLGSREFWVGLVWVVLMVMLFMGWFVLMIPLMIVGAIAGAAKAGAIGGLFVLLAAVALFGVLVWAALRLSMGPVMSFAENSFVLFESWRLTRGAGWRLFGALLALWALLVVVELALFVVVMVVAAAVPFPAFDAAALAEPGAMSRLLLHPVAVLGMLLLSLVTAAWYAVCGGAWADLYRQLTAPEPAA